MCPSISSSVPGTHNTLFNFVCRYDASKHELMFLSSNGIYKTLEYTESLPPYHPASLALQMDVKCQKEHIFSAEGALCVVFSYPYHISTAHNITPVIFSLNLSTFRNLIRLAPQHSTQSVSCSLTSWFELKSRVLNKM